MDEKMTPNLNNPTSSNTPVSEDSGSFSEFQLVSKKSKNNTIKVIMIVVGVILSLAFFVGFYFLLGIINS